MPGYYADDIETSVRSRRGIPGLDVYETERRGAARSGPPIGEPAVAARPVTPTATLQPSAIKGLDIAEGITQARNPNVGPAGSAEARAFQSGLAPAAADIAAPAVGPVARAAGLAGRVARGVAGGVPAIAGGVAFDAAGRVLGDNTQGGPGPTLAPGAAQIPTRGPNGEAEVAPAAVPGNIFRDTETGRNVGNIINATGAGRIASAATRGAAVLQAGGRNAQLASPVARGADVAVQGISAANAAAPTIAAALPAVSAAQPVNTADPRIGPRLDNGIVRTADPAIGPETQANVLRTTTPGVTRAPGERSAIDIERAALGIEQQNSALRQQADAYGSGARNPDGSGGAAFIGSDIAAKNRETGIASLRNDARLASGLRQKELLDAAQQQEGLGDQAAIARERNAADTSRAASGEATARRGQDIAAASAQGQVRGQKDIAALQGDTQRDVASLSADSRLAAAEARANATKYQAINLPDRLAPDGLTVLKGGQVLVGSDGKKIDFEGADKPAASAPPGMKQVGTSNGKPVYEDAKGKRFIGG